MSAGRKFLLLAVLSPFVSSGCGPAIPEEELGEIQYGIPDIPGSEKPVKVTPYRPEAPAQTESRSGESEASPARDEKSVPGVDIDAPRPDPKESNNQPVEPGSGRKNGVPSSESAESLQSLETDGAPN